MFFTASKLFWMAFAPLTFLSLVLLIGLIFYSKKIGQFIVKYGLIVFLCLGFLPIGPNLLTFLETVHPAPSGMAEKVDGIIVLGGGIDAHASRLYGKIQAAGPSSRLLEMMELSKVYPQAKIVYSGGSGDLNNPDDREADVVREFLANTGNLSKNMVFEADSRSTYENMVQSRDLVHPQAGENWLLVTSAYHMPRAAAVFKNNGWPVTPWPTGYVEEGEYRLLPSLDVLGNIYKLQVAAKEIIGIIAYTLTGRI
jgi:uncharacterized SAM-binding protein YcdF (DUF218 family)